MEGKQGKARRFPRVLVQALLFGGVGWGVWWLASPSYLEMDIPVPQHGIGAPEVWDHESRAQVSYFYPGRGGKDYVLRRVGRVYPDHDHEWKSQEDIVGFLDRWLTARGWIRRDIYTGGDPVIPEIYFLGESHPGVRHYTRSGDQWGHEDRVAFAVWPIRSGEDMLGYNVVLATVRSSFLRWLRSSAFD